MNDSRFKSLDDLKTYAAVDARGMPLAHFQYTNAQVARCIERARWVHVARAALLGVSVKIPYIKWAPFVLPPDGQAVTARSLRDAEVRIVDDGLDFEISFDEGKSWIPSLELLQVLGKAAEHLKATPYPRPGKKT